MQDANDLQSFVLDAEENDVLPLGGNLAVRE